MQKIIDYFKSLGVGADATATIVITLFTFSLGLFLAWLAKQLKTSKERKSYRKSLLLILKDFSKACQKQEKIVLKSLETTGLKYGNDFVVKFVSIGTLEYLNKLDFNIFLQNFRPLFCERKFPKAISKLFELFSQIKIQNDNLNTFTKTFFDRYRENEIQYHESISALRQIHDELGVHLDGKDLDRDNGGDLVQGYFKIFGDCQRNGMKKDTMSTYNEIVLKTLELTKNNQKVPLILKLNDHSLKCDHAYENIIKIDNLLIDKFKQFAFFHRRAYRLINVIIKILD